MTLQPELGPMRAAPTGVAGTATSAVAELLADGEPARRRPSTLSWRARVSARRAGGGDLRLAGRGRARGHPAMDPCGSDRAPFERLAGTDLWLLRLPVEDGGRFEYKLAIGRQGGEEWILDPLNPARARDPFGENSVCRTSATRARSGASRAARRRAYRSRRGRQRRRSASAAASGSICRRARSGPGLSLVVIHDGEDFVTYADLRSRSTT